MPEVIIEMYIRGVMAFLSKAMTNEIFNNENNPSAQAYNKLNGIEQALVGYMLRKLTLNAAQNLGFMEIVDDLIKSGRKVYFRCPKVKGDKNISFCNTNPGELKIVFKTHSQTDYVSKELFRRILEENGIYAITVSNHFQMGAVADKVDY